MKPKTILLLFFALPLFCMAQRQLVISYEYDAAGNRVLRKTVNIIPRDSLELSPPDSTIVELPTPEDEEVPTGSPDFAMQDSLPTTEEFESPKSLMSFEPTSPPTPEYFVEKIAQVEIKIYPNPATEKITLEFSGDVRVENFRPLRLYSLSGQLLQEQPVHSVTTEVSLAGLAKGAYILKVQINNTVEDWKIIKN